MSVISQMEVTPNRVGILYRFLDSQSSPLSEEALLSFLSPSSLQPKKGEDGDETSSVVAQRVLKESKALGLVESGPEEGTVQVPASFRGLDQAGLRAVLAHWLTDPDEAAFRGQEQVPYALAWFLCQSPASPLAFRENQGKAIEAETGGRPLELTNASRFQQLSYWVQYLGLGWQIPTTNGPELVSDPTGALALELEAVLSGSGAMPVHEAIEAVAKRLPVIETGVAREEVEGWLPATKQRGASALSPSTSLALLRLQSRRAIALEQSPDAQGMMRLLTWPDAQRVSHVAWTKNQVGR